MRKNYVTILVLAMATGLLLADSRLCWAEEKNEKSIWSEDEPGRRHRRLELTDERIERMMERLKEAKPEKAEELEKLRKEDPEKFRAELRKAMRERFGQRYREGMEGGGRRGGREFGREADKPSTRPGGRGERGGRDEPGRRGGRGMMWERHGEFLEWFKKSYPEEAEKLSGLRKRKPKDYDRRLGLSLRKYRRIFEAEKENPKLAKALKKDLELKEKRGKLLRKIRATKDDDKKQNLIEELNEVVSSRFDLLVRRKQIEYEQLLKKLEKLKKEVKEREAEVEKWKDANFKSKNVKARVKDLVSGKEKFRWE